MNSNISNSTLTNLDGFIDKIQNLLSEQDQKFINKDIDMAIGLKNKLRELQNSEEVLNARKELSATDFSYWYFAKEIEIAGSKAVLHLLKNNSESRIAELIEKLNKDKFKKRNARILKALEKNQVKQINDIKQNVSEDGFDGVYEVTTESGKKKLFINTIIAWGEIQRPHYRTLVKVK